MEAAWNIMQQPIADDFIIATGEAHSVEEFLNESFAIVNLNPKNYVKINPKFLRPSKNTTLIGDVSKAKKTFGFNPQIKFKQLVKLMVEEDIRTLK